MGLKGHQSSWSWPQWPKEKAWIQVLALISRRWTKDSRNYNQNHNYRIHRKNKLRKRKVWRIYSSKIIKRIRLKASCQVFTILIINQISNQTSLAKETPLWKPWTNSIKTNLQDYRPIQIFHICSHRESQHLVAKDKEIYRFNKTK